MFPVVDAAPALLDAAPDGFIGTDESGCIVWANTQAERLFGYCRAELVRQPIDRLIPEWRREVRLERFTGSGGELGQRAPFIGQPFAARRKDGTAFSIEMSLSVVRTDAETLLAVIVRDVTDVSREQSRLRALLEAAPDAIVGVDADGRIVEVNAQAERLFGYQRCEMLGRSLEILVPHHLRDRHPQHRKRYSADPQPRPMGAGMLLSALRKDGTEFPAEISLSAIDTDDGILVSAAVRDVTERIEAQAERERLKAAAERERLEAQLHQSQRLESLGQLAGGVAHDFNNLLAVMLNYSNFVAELVDEAAGREPDGEWPAAAADLRQIIRAGRRAAELTHQLLAFGRREVVRPRVLDLNAIISEIDNLLRRTIGEHVRLHVELEGDLHPVLADPGQIEQVLVNLAVNARDAMPNGGTLTVQTSNQTIQEPVTPVPGVTSPPSGTYVSIRIADTGTGMPPDVLARVFEPFFTTKPKGVGTGLGLATVYGIITQAGGHASIETAPGMGTAFIALLPACEAAPPSEPAVAPPPRLNRGGETVLLVEDEEALREVTRRLLVRNGYRVHTAANGLEALDLAEQCRRVKPVDLLLTDVVMPHMRGDELSDLLRATHSGLRTIYMSGYAEPFVVDGGFLHPGIILVTKPFTELDLLDTIRQCLDA
jgi:PAS domain S-box-containing protein